MPASARSLAHPVQVVCCVARSAILHTHGVVRQLAGEQAHNGGLSGAALLGNDPDHVGHGRRNGTMEPCFLGMGDPRRAVQSRSG